jgi:hypothetical protein
MSLRPGISTAQLAGAKNLGALSATQKGTVPQNSWGKAKTRIKFNRLRIY